MNRRDFYFYHERLEKHEMKVECKVVCGRWNYFFSVSVPRSIGFASLFFSAGGTEKM